MDKEALGFISTEGPSFGEALDNLWTQESTKPRSSPVRAGVPTKSRQGFRWKGGDSLFRPARSPVCFQDSGK